jgi:hypothetical protein
MCGVPAMTGAATPILQDLFSVAYSKPAKARHTPAFAPVSPAATGGYVWRRLHDGQLIAQVSRLEGIGSWLVSACSSRSDGNLVRIARSFSLLTDAQRAADNLVRDSFSHTCRTGECGRWLRWPEAIEQD